MLLVVGIGLLSFLVSLLLTPLCRNVSCRFGLTDQPEPNRKTHNRPTSRVGGVAIFLACLASVGIPALVSRAPRLPTRDLDRLLPAVLVVFLIGLADDIWSLAPWQKLCGQFAAAAMACAAGVQIQTVAAWSIAGTWWHVPITMIWLVGCANAFNLIDGVDGLAAGVGFFATLTTFVAALLSANYSLAVATAPLVGALLGFLRYNFNPATIFLGDCGSLSIGFLLGCYGVIWSQKSATLLGMTAPLIALSIPILDTAISIVRRFLRGQPIFGADRRHIHHRLLDRGLTPRRVALLMYGVAAVAAACSLLISVSDNQLGGLIIMLFCAAAWLGVQHLGYNEFQQARNVLFGGMIGRVIDTQVLLSQLDARLAGAHTPDERWHILRDASRNFGFNAVNLSVDGRRWSERTRPVPPAGCWQISVPLRDSGVAEFLVPLHARPHPINLAPLVNIVRRHLGPSPRHTATAPDDGISQSMPVFGAAKVSAVGSSSRD
ncbi:MAG TPA: MraY family glycosyltransferase [Bryobacteraceae bacterium]|nr:MraY family glycosyltransferase [Bryobacteraceae bacterium]